MHLFTRYLYFHVPTSTNIQIHCARTYTHAHTPALSHTHKRTYISCTSILLDKHAVVRGYLWNMIRIARSNNTCCNLTFSSPVTKSPLWINCRAVSLALSFIYSFSAEHSSRRQMFTNSKPSSLPVHLPFKLIKQPLHDVREWTNATNLTAGK